MAYGLLHTLEGKSRIYSNHWKVKIYRKDYVGPEINYDVPSNPFRLCRDASTVIKGTSLEFGIRSRTDFEFLEYYTSNDREFLVELYLSDTLKWKGFLLPEQYLEPYKPTPTNIFFTATDGLGYLKNITYDLSIARKLGYKWVSQIDIITNVLSLLDLNIGIDISINARPYGESTNRAPLEQVKENLFLYLGMSCYEVLEHIIGKWDAEITQENGAWLIRRYSDKNKTRLSYTSQGVYSSTRAAPAVLDLGRMGDDGVDIWPVGHLQMSIEAAKKGIYIKHDYGLRDSFLQNSSFEGAEATGYFNEWDKVGTFTVSKYFDRAYQVVKGWKARYDNVRPDWTIDEEYMLKTQGSAYYDVKYRVVPYLDPAIIGDSRYLFLHGYQVGESNCYKQTISITASESCDFIFRCKCATFGFKLYSSSGKNSLNMVGRIRVRLLTGGTYYYLHKTNGWTTTPTTMQFSIASSFDKPAWQQLEVITDPLPGSGELTVYLYQYVGEPGTDETFLGIAFDDVNVSANYNGGDYPVSSEINAVFTESPGTVKYNDTQIFTADAPDVPNKALAYDCITRKTNDVPTDKWVNDDNITQLSFLELLVNELGSRNRSPRQVLQGVIRVNAITFDTMLRHAYNDSRVFEIDEAEYQLCEDRMSVKLVEYLPHAMSDTLDVDDVLVDDPGCSTTSFTITDVWVGTDYEGEPLMEEISYVNGGNAGDWHDLDYELYFAGDDSLVTSGYFSPIGPFKAGSDSIVNALLLTFPVFHPSGYYLRVRVHDDEPDEWVTSDVFFTTPNP